MPTSPAEQAAQQRARAHAGGGRRRPHPRMPSTAGYMFVAGTLSLILFWFIWVLLRSESDEAPWLPAGLAAGFVILIAAFARGATRPASAAPITSSISRV